MDLIRLTGLWKGTDKQGIEQVSDALTRER